MSLRLVIGSTAKDRLTTKGKQPTLHEANYRMAFTILDTSKIMPSCTLDGKLYYTLFSSDQRDNFNKNTAINNFTFKLM